MPINSIKVIVIFFIVILLNLILVPNVKANTPQSPQSFSWDYFGTNNPHKWGELSNEFKYCQQGKQQSPVDLVSKSEMQMSAIKFDYKDSPLKIINNGRTIKVDYASGSFIEINDKQYELLQFHFHSPSEHTVDGKKYAIEAHFVHKAQDDTLAVIGVFLKEGKPNNFIHLLWANLPEQEGEKNITDISINASELFPTDKSYYHYSGSLTTPPCTEDVSWNVLKTPIEISARQIARFSSVYNGNARPVQPLNERVIEAN